MNTAGDVLNLTLTEAARLVRTGAVSPVELVEATLARIDAWDPRLHASTSACSPEQAREVAKAMEVTARAGHILGPLHGVPIALKDNIAAQGFATTAGSKILAAAVSKEDATVTSRLREAGAVLLGKLNMHEFAWGGTSANPHYGTVANPWNPARFAGGLSGGSGAAVAARMCYGALGTDTGGSIMLRRPPSMACVHFRPTYGRVSNHGIIPLAWTWTPPGRGAHRRRLRLDVQCHRRP